MNVGSYFSVKDFLNYYIAGLIWLADILMVLLIIDKTAFDNTLSEISKYSNNTNLVLGGVFILLTPYLVGFVLSQLSTWFGEKIRNRQPDPVKWVVDDPEKNKAGLKSGEIGLIKKYIKNLSSSQNPNPEEWFFVIRAYVENHGGGAAALASRALDLTNFSESIVIAFPFFLFTISICFFKAQDYLLGIIALMLAGFAYSSIKRRYLDQRSYWIKHVYSAFIAICLNEEMAKNDKEVALPEANGRQ